MPITDDELASELQRKLDLWLWNGVLWERVHWLVGVIGIASSAIASATAADEGTRIFSVIATACMGVLGFANPQKRSQRYLQAYRLVDTALREYRALLVSRAALLAEHRRAEELLNEGERHDPVPEQH